MTGSQPWMMQCASAMLIGVFAASMWLAGQSFVERATNHRSAPGATAASAICSDRTPTGGVREDTAHRSSRSCVLAAREPLFGATLRADPPRCQLKKRAIGERNPPADPRCAAPRCASLPSFPELPTRARRSMARSLNTKPLHAARTIVPKSDRTICLFPFRPYRTVRVSSHGARQQRQQGVSVLWMRRRRSAVTLKLFAAVQPDASPNVPAEHRVVRHLGRSQYTGRLQNRA